MLKMSFTVLFWWEKFLDAALISIFVLRRGTYSGVAIYQGHHLIIPSKYGTLACNVNEGMNLLAM